MTVLLHFDCSMVLTLLQALCKCLVSRCATHFFKIFFGFFVIYIYIYICILSTGHVLWSGMVRTRLVTHKRKAPSFTTAVDQAPEICCNA
jgi:hypothetical protein